MNIPPFYIAVAFIAFILFLVARGRIALWIWLCILAGALGYFVLGLIAVIGTGENPIDQMSGALVLLIIIGILIAIFVSGFSRSKADDAGAPKTPLGQVESRRLGYQGIVMIIPFTVIGAALLAGDVTRELFGGVGIGCIGIAVLLIIVTVFLLKRSARA